MYGLSSVMYGLSSVMYGFDKIFPQAYRGFAPMAQPSAMYGFDKNG